jgi:TatD DNase family protein
MDILREYPDVTGEFHSFSASGEIARQLVNRGWYISFSGVITFKNAARLAEIVPTVPLDRVMIETDAPYLAPVPYRGKMNHSGLMEYTAARAAELYGIPAEEFARHAYENACRFFGVEE